MAEVTEKAVIKVILDLDGVVFEPIQNLVVKAAMKKYGRVKGCALLACYKFGVLKGYVTKHISDIAYDYTIKAPFMQGAEDAIAALQEYCSIDVCSKINWYGNNKKLEAHYRQTSPYMNKIEKYNFVNPGESKATIYMQALTEAKTTGTRVFIVDDLAENFKKIANIRGLNKAIVSDKGKEINLAREYCARHFQTLSDFQQFIAHEK